MSVHARTCVCVCLYMGGGVCMCACVIVGLESVGVCVGRCEDAISELVRCARHKKADVLTLTVFSYESGRSETLVAICLTIIALSHKDNTHCRYESLKSWRLRCTDCRRHFFSYSEVERRCALHITHLHLGLHVVTIIPDTSLTVRIYLWHSFI